MTELHVAPCKEHDWLELTNVADAKLRRRHFVCKWCNLNRFDAVPQKTGKCQVCGKECYEQWSLGYFQNGWKSHHWTCKHGATKTCPECNTDTLKFFACPICRCSEEYT